MSSKIFVLASGTESKEFERKLYIGVGSVYVVGVNPNKDVLSSFFNYNAEEPEYISTDSEGIPQARIDFLVNTDPQSGIELKTKISFFLKKQIRYNKDKTKVQVIDKYGRTAWATVEEAKNKTIPSYANGPASIDASYRPAYIGEEELTSFIKTYLNIPNVSSMYIDKKTKERVIKNNPDPDSALARLDKIEDYFKGDFKEIKSIPKFQPKNTVKCMFGVKTSDDGRQFQAVYTQKFLRPAVSDYSKLDAELQERKNAGAYSSVEFDVLPLREYKVESTNFSSRSSDANKAADPFGEPMDNSPWFLGN